MRKLFVALSVVATAVAFPTTNAFAVPTVGAADDLVTDQTYVRHDGGTDDAIESCNDDDPANIMGANVQNNEPFSVVSPTNPDLVVAGWNDYCSDWMGLAFSTNGGEDWTDSLVPGYPADTSAEGMASPEFGRTNAGSDPVGAFDRTGEHFYFGGLAFNQFAGPGTNSDVWVARYDVLDPGDDGYETYPLDYVGTTQVGKGPPAANFFGIFHDKEMIEVDRTGGDHDGNVYECWTKFPGFGTSRIYFSRSTDEGATFSKGISIAGKTSGQGCDVAVEADGDVYVSWRDFDLASSHRTFGMSVVRSSDGGQTFSKPVKIAEILGYNPFDTFSRDCGDGSEACPAGFVFARVPLEPRLTSDPTGQLEGVFSVFQASDPDTVEPSDTSYSSTGPGTFGTEDVAQGFVWISRSVDDGQTWSEPVKVSDVPDAHQFFPDADALAGTLAVVWQDNRNGCYDVQLPIGNTVGATSCGDEEVDAFVSVSTDGETFGSAIKASSIANQPQYEMFANRSVPFYGDYDWIQLVEDDGALFGYMTWTDNRDVVTGTDPREAVQDGFDVHQCRALQTDGTFGPDTCPNAGGLNQNIYGNSITIP